MLQRKLMTLSLVLACAAIADQAAAATAYVSNEKGNTISVVDLDKMETIATVPVGERPRGITLSHDKKLLYICTSDADHIEVLDLETLQGGPDACPAARIPSCSCCRGTAPSSTSRTRTTTS